MDLMHRAGIWEGTQNVYVLSEHHSAHICVFTSLEALQIPRFGGFMEASIRWLNRANHWPLVTDLNH